ncbi:MAG: Ig-like domain-containing protein, partial [Gemmatimonadota bacterium]
MSGPRHVLSGWLLLAVLAAGACGSDVLEPAADSFPGPAPTPDPVPEPDPAPEPPPAAGLAASVVEVNPSAHHTSASTATAITIEFDRPIDPTSIDPTVFRVFGRWSGVATGTHTVEAAGARIRFAPDAEFAAGEFVTVTLAGSIRLADGTPLGRGFAWSFWTAAGVGGLDQLNVGTRTVRRPGEGLIQAYGAYAGDIDGDGDSDLVIPNEVANDIRVFLN